MGTVETNAVTIEREAVERTIAEDRAAIEAARRQSTRSLRTMRAIRRAVDDLLRGYEQRRKR